MNTAGDEERLRSWIFEVVEALVEGARWRTEGDERRLLGHAGLTINMRTGAWYAHGSGCGGWSVIPLIGLLKVCSRAEAVESGERDGLSRMDAIKAVARQRGLSKREVYAQVNLPPKR